MSTPIYKLFLIKPSQAWYQLPLQQQNELLLKVNESLKAVGGEIVLACDSYWSSEQWPMFGIQMFPSLEAVQKHSEDLKKLNWFGLGESFTVLGTVQQPS